ncbi:molecular chaperone [Rosenbergiella australiborealis]|uniref:Molecular chaperone n=1 Tax=Rosenbergiella australiborealis TaxID=1544696 RepID=A0ABS5T7X8_9GAMM|nr:molecular chaperone [Rosenbergiella australiborealis]MBT0727620.1 molecular chaperone [Rosenbergiella australiborealis]
MKNRINLLACACLMLASSVHAGVVMIGTRVIFPGGASNTTIQLKNPDPLPYVMQLQLTHEDNSPNDKAPFVIVPPVFRMEPNSGQTVRLIANGAEKLPMDRESVFYLNFTQLPSQKNTDQNKNQLIIAITNRVKIFYRPKDLTGTQNEAYKYLTFSTEHGKIVVTNPTGYFITVRRAVFSTGNRSITLAQSVMVAPKSTTTWPISENITSLSGGQMKLTLVNDYGADIESKRDL